jgi:hypothetical protein
VFASQLTATRAPGNMPGEFGLTMQDYSWKSKTRNTSFARPAHSERDRAATGAGLLRVCEPSTSDVPCQRDRLANQPQMICVWRELVLNKWIGFLGRCRTHRPLHGRWERRRTYPTAFILLFA